MLSRELPQLVIPFLPRSHPDRDQVETAGLEWIKTYAPTDTQYQRLVETKCGHLVTRWASQAPRSVLDCYSRLLMWSFWFDDLFIDDADANSPLLAPVIASVLDILAGGRGDGTAGEGMEKALYDVLCELRAILTTVQFTCFAMETREWFLSCALQNSLRRVNLPLLSSYLTTRHYAADALPWLVLVGASQGAKFSWDEYYNRELTKLRFHAANVIAIQNDIFSFFAESRYPGKFWNVPAVLQARGCSVQEALQEAADLANAEVEKFLTTKECSEHELSAAARAFVAGCEDTMRGSYDWSHERAGRYPGWNLHRAEISETE